MAVSKNDLVKAWKKLGCRYDHRNNAFKTMLIDFYFDHGRKVATIMKYIGLPRDIIHNIFYDDVFGKKYFASKNGDTLVKAHQVDPRSHANFNPYLTAQQNTQQKDKPTRIFWPKETKEKVISMYNSGKTGADIAKELGVPYSTVNKWILKHTRPVENVPKTRQSVDWSDKAFVAEIIDYLVDNQYTITKVADDLGISVSVLQKVLYQDPFGKKYYADKKAELEAKTREANKAAEKAAEKATSVELDMIDNPEIVSVVLFRDYIKYPKEDTCKLYSISAEVYDSILSKHYPVFRKLLPLILAVPDKPSLLIQRVMANPELRRDTQLAIDGDLTVGNFIEKYHEPPVNMICYMVALNSYTEGFAKCRKISLELAEDLKNDFNKATNRFYHRIDNAE